MNKIIDYKIVFKTNQVTLTIQVNEYIAAGWQPYGSIVVSEIGLYQALVRYDEPCHPRD